MYEPVKPLFSLLILAWLSPEMFHQTANFKPFISLLLYLPDYQQQV